MVSLNQQKTGLPSLDEAPRWLLWVVLGFFGSGIILALSYATTPVEGRESKGVKEAIPILFGGACVAVCYTALVNLKENSKAYHIKEQYREKIKKEEAFLYGELEGKKMVEKYWDVLPEEEKRSHVARFGLPPGKTISSIYSPPQRQPAPQYYSESVEPFPPESYEEEEQYYEEPQPSIQLQKEPHQPFAQPIPTAVPSVQERILAPKSQEPNDYGDWVAPGEKIGTPLEEFFKQYRLNVTEFDPADGMTCTEHRLVPDAGVKVDRLLSHQKDLTAFGIDGHISEKLGYVAVTVRKSQEEREWVYFNDPPLPPCPNPNGCCILLGYNVLTRKPVIVDLSDSNNTGLLGAGTTGSGKTEAMFSMAASAAYWYGLESIRFAIYDGKLSSSFNCFNNSPSLFGKISYTREEGIALLRDVENERQRRQELFNKGNYRDIIDYNERSGNKLPRILFFLDEISTLTNEKTDPESARVARALLETLARMCRSAGISLIVFDQYPKSTTVPVEVKMNLNVRMMYKLRDDKKRTANGLILGKNYPSESLLGYGNGFVQINGNEEAEIQSALLRDHSILGISDEPQQHLDPIPLQYEDDYDYVEAPDLANSTAVESSAGIDWEKGADCPVLKRIVWDCVQQGHSLTYTAEKVVGVKKGGNNPKYEEIRKVFNSLNGIEL